MDSMSMCTKRRSKLQLLSTTVTINEQINAIAANKNILTLLIIFVAMGPWPWPSEMV